ncbi:Uncharacterised protein [Mycobacterium tuberculosis]|nr:Uncharacterised protein [Mycobacterium tuberculosis]
MNGCSHETLKIFRPFQMMQFALVLIMRHFHVPLVHLTNINSVVM